MNIQTENNSVAGFSLESEERGMYYLIRIGGRFDAQVLPQIRREVEKAMEIGHIHLAFDLEKTKFMASSGIGILANLFKTMQAKGGGLSIIAMPSIVRESLSTTQILKVIPHYETMEEADRHIGS